MIRSRGVLSAVRSKSTTTLWQGTTRDWPEWLSFAQGSYATMYERDLWTNVLVDKIGNAAARLPLQTFEQVADGRIDASDTPYGRLMSRPSSMLDPYLWKLWIFSTIGVYGEAFLGKRRDRGGRPIELVPLHPTRVFDEVDRSTGVVSWTIRDDPTSTRTPIARRDLVHFRGYSPSSQRRGLSKLEPLRSTLENEWGARQANAAMWRNGGRPSVMLEHPGQLSDPALQRLQRQWDDRHAGVQNWAKAVILEEGMKANAMTLNVEELQYVDGRRLNREEVCAAYDVPPPVVHILDRATFSNITAQMRSMYRDTMAPKLGLVESTFEFEVRDGRMGADGEPDFGAELRAKFLMDEVLRGDFEQRMTAYQQADFMTIAEKREKENLPFIEGTDRVFLNSASLPLSADGTLEQPQPTAVDDEARALSPQELAEMMQKLYLSVGVVVTVDEARALVNRAGGGLGAAPAGELAGKAATPDDMRSIAARTGRATFVRELDVDHVCRGLSPAGVAAVLDAVGALGADATTDDLRNRLRGAA